LRTSCYTYDVLPEVSKMLTQMKMLGFKPL